MVTGTTELLVGFTGVFGGMFETTGMTGVVLGMGGTFLLGIWLNIMGVVGTLFDNDIDEFNLRLVEPTVGGTGECKTFVEIFFLIVSNGGLEGSGLEIDTFGFKGLIAVDFGFVGLEGFTGTGLEVVCLE